MKDKERLLTSSGELNRMRILSRYKLLRTLPETLLDDLVCLTAALFDVPVALVSLTDVESGKATAADSLGDTWAASEEEAICTVAVRREETAVLEEMAPKPFELANPFVTRALNFRFYAATSLKGANGENIGSLCVVGRQPRTFSPTEREVLSNLAALVVLLLDLRRKVGPDSSVITTMWNQVYSIIPNALHRSLALAERLHQQQDLETITAVIQRKLICKDANYIATVINEHITSLL